MLIYRFTNRLNGKVYIGQTVKTFVARRNLHDWNVRKGSRQAVHCAIRKYGWENFEQEVIHRAKSIEELDAMETFFIILHQSFRPENGYNRNLGGYKRKNKGQVPWNKGKLGAQIAWNRGKQMSEEFREKCKAHDMFAAREAQRKGGWTMPDSWHEKMNGTQSGSKNPFFGRTHSPETRAKMRLAKQLRREKISTQSL